MAEWHMKYKTTKGAVLGIFSRCFGKRVRLEDNVCKISGDSLGMDIREAVNYLEQRFNVKVGREVYGRWDSKAGIPEEISRASGATFNDIAKYFERYRRDKAF